MVPQGKMITVTRRLDALLRERRWLEEVIREAEVRFRDQEVEQDWSSQPIENDRPAEDQPRSTPPSWNAAVECAAALAVAYAKAELETAPDPTRFEFFTDDVAAVVAQTTFLNKLSEYMRDPGNISSFIVKQFIADVLATTKKAMKKLRRDAWRQVKPTTKPEVKSAAGASPPQPQKPSPARKAKKAPTRRKPKPNIEELVAGKEYISPEHAIEWFGTTDRNLRKLIEKRRIDVRGEGQNRQISVASLRRYFAV